MKENAHICIWLESTRYPKHNGGKIFEIFPTGKEWEPNEKKNSNEGAPTIFSKIGPGIQKNQTSNLAEETPVHWYLVGPIGVQLTQ